MKKVLLLSAAMLTGIATYSQKEKEEMNTQTGVITCDHFGITRPLRELAAEHPMTEERLNELRRENIRESKDRDKREPQKFKFSAEKDGAAYGNDPSFIQNKPGTEPNKAPIMNIAGQNATGFRPMDPTGAAGTTYYVQAINSTTYRVYNKTTGATVLTGTLGNLWSPATPNDGDPIVMYDRYADRWFISQFGSSGNKIYIAISTTNDPTGSYYTYTFTSPQFPDYLKFSIWVDGYYMTSNQGTQKVFAFERTAMLAGSPTAKVVYTNFTPPTGGGFFCPMPGDADGNGGLPAAGTPCPIFTYSDNAWGAGITDAIHVYHMAVNWVPATPTATITSVATLATAAFDASYSATWDDVSQPGTTQKLDGIGGVLQFRAQWRKWSTYRTTVVTWPVKVSATQRSLMWAELRQDVSTGVWSIYQQGLYAPDTKTRWLGSIAMDDNGGIALCYARASTTAGDYMSLYYTGRKSCDPLNTLPITEQLAIAGTGAQTGGVNRDGDYSQTSLDPDGITFWNTAEYMGGPTGGTAARTRVYSFQLPTCAAVTPVAAFSGTPTTVCAGGTVNFTDLSTNSPTSWSWTFPGGTPSSSTSQNPSVVYSTPGTYNVTLMATNGAGSNSVTQTGYITVNAVPATPTLSSSSPDCVGQTISLTGPTVAGATYSWTGPSSFTSALQNPTRPGATVAMAGTYSLTVTVGGCTSAAGTTSVVINTVPSTPTASNTGPYCAGSTISLSTPTVAGASYSWTGPGGYTSTTQNPTITSSTTAMSGTYSVTITNASGCTSAAGTTSVTVNAIPSTPTASSTSPYCSGSTISLSTPTAAGATYSWTGPGGYTATTQNPTRPASTVAMSGTYSVTITVAGCASAAGTTSVVVNPTPATPTASSTGPYCAGTTISLSTPTVAGAAYSWTGPSAFSSSLQNPTRPSATTAMSGTYSVTVTNGGCTSLAGTVSVTVNALPSTPTASSSSPDCTGQTISLTTPTIAGAVYSWTGPSSYSSAVQNPTIPGATTAMAGTYSVTVTVAGCTSLAGTTAIIVNTTPVTPTASSTGPYCSGSAISLSTPTAGGSTYSWTGPGGFTSTLQNPTIASSTTAMSGTYSVTVTSGAGCTSAAGTTAVTVNPTPSMTAPSNATYCNGDAASASSFSSVPAGAIYSWTNSNTAIGLGASGTGNVPAFTATNTGTSPISGTITITPSIGSCNGTPVTYTITVNPTPATPTVTQAGLVLTSSSATGNQWYLNGVIISGATSQTYTVTTNGNYTVDVTTGGCPSAPSAVVTVINVGIEDANNIFGLSIYPNPNDGNFNVTFSALSRSNYTLALYNALGQIVYKEEIKDHSGTYTKKFSVTEYGKGTYTITLTNSDNETVKRIIVY
ncbi:MAG: PKD domain-containing protein [Bacteroidia bacterium]